MNRLFSARFDIMDITPLVPGQWTIMGYVIDNTGNFFAGDSGIGDIIYLDGSMLGLQVLRYRIVSIDYDKLSGTELHANIEWDMGSEDPIDPFVGLSGIVGRASEDLKLAAIPSTTIDMLDESFITAIVNYENAMIIDKLAPTDSPEFTGKPLVPTADRNSNDKQAANTEWINMKLDNIDGVRIYTTLEDIEAFKVLYINDSECVGLADGNNPDHADAIIGISLESKLAGEQISVKLEGELQYDNWNFAKTGKTIFVGTNGDITLQPDSVTGFIQPIGITADNNAISLNIEEAVLL